MIRDLASAVRLLTVLPVPIGRPHRDRPGRAATWFPLVGLLVGAIVYTVLILPVPPLPRAAFALVAWVALTGGLHEDGLADCADAAFAVATRERRLDILKDPRVGAHGAAAAMLGLLFRFSVLAVITPIAAPVAAVLGRTVMAVSLATVPPARMDGLGAAYHRGARALQPLAVGAVLMGALGLFAGARTLAAIAAAGLTAAAAARFLGRRFGGLNGDGHGAVGLLAEMAALAAFLPIQTWAAP